MIYFVATLVLLFILSMYTFDSNRTFCKEKMPLLRVIMAFVIILGHLAPQVELPFVLPFRFWGAPFVSVFFFISGYGVASSRIENFKTFLSKRVLKIILPLLTTIIIYALLVGIPSKIGYGNPVLTILNDSLHQHHLWFVWAILALYLTQYFCWKLKESWQKVTTLYFISALLCILLWWMEFGRCWYVSLLAFPTGAFYSTYKDKVNKLCYQNRLHYLVSFSIIILLAAVFFITKIEVLYSVSHIFIASAVAMVATQIPYEKFNNRIIAYLGAISYEIYLCQLTSIEFLRGTIINIPSDTVYVLLTLVMITMLAACMHYFCNIRRKTNG